MFHKLLIANRGEIACRIARTAHRLGVVVAAVYSQADAHARHVRLADEAWPIGPAPAQESYLDAEAILDAARRCGADAVHPGYGFLAESAAFAAAVAASGLIFVGPPAEAIAAMGEKAAAKERMRRAGVPVLPGYHGADQSLAALERHGERLGFPLIVKPASGGGGKGMQIVRAAADLGAALEASRRIAASAFGDEHLLLERYLPAARHVEVQVLCDRQGTVLHLLDRDCSVQRRYQKLIEEAPAPDLGAPVRAAMSEAACRVAREVAYAGAGTVEFLIEGEAFYFIEMNTRLQVEHPVTEAVTGLDLVECQLRIAAGEPLAIAQADIASHGHAIEARVCAEDPALDFLPVAGRLRRAAWPQEEPGVRVDVGFETGDTVPPHYDSLLGKVIAHAPTRSEAIGRLLAALRATRIAGVPTNIGWLCAALESAAFRAGPADTSFVARLGAAGGAGVERSPRADGAALLPFAAAAEAFALQGASSPRSPWNLVDGFRLGGAEPIEVRLLHGDVASSAEVLVIGGSRVEVSFAGRPLAGTFDLAGRGEDAILEVRSVPGGPSAEALVSADRIDIWREGRYAEFRKEDPAAARSASPRAAGSLTAKLPGVVAAVQVSPGDAVAADQVLLVVEAMKMEHKVLAPGDGVVGAVHVRVGDRVTEGDSLVTMAAAGSGERR
ncbi:MAG: acetyl/propionyl/methylcrotonyl-CoA carboxylase subunit alpha [Steroidobacteraceae bacterium]